MHPIIESAQCESHPDFDGGRSPTSDCIDCWGYYNLMHDLPIGNSTPKSRFKKVVRLSSRVPDMYPMPFMDRPGPFFRLLKESVEKLGAERFHPVSMGIDASLRSTGVAMIGYDSELDCWYTSTFSDGMDLSQDASAIQKMNRQISIIQSCVKAYKSFVSEGEHISVSIEDHAYSRAHTNNATEAHELHGVIKSQFYLLTGRAVEPVGIKSARAEVFCHGSPPGDAKKALLEALEKEEYQWVEGLTDDEIDAWTVGSVRVKKDHPFGTFEVNNG